MPPHDVQAASQRGPPLRMDNRVAFELLPDPMNCQDAGHTS